MLRLGVDLGLRDEAHPLLVGLGDDLRGLVPAGLDDGLAAAQDLLSLVDLLRELRPQLIEQAEHLRPVDHAGRGHRHRAGALDEGDELVEGVVDGHGRDVLL